MDADRDTLAIALYGRVYDLLKDRPELVPWRPRVGIAPKLSDADPRPSQGDTDGFRFEPTCCTPIHIPGRCERSAASGQGRLPVRRS